MKKLISLLGLFFFTALAAPVKPSALLAPTATDLQRACDDGYLYAQGGFEVSIAPYIYLLKGTLDNGYSLQNVQGSVISTCNKRARNLEAKPNPNTLPKQIAVILAGSTDSDRISGVKDWAAVLSIRDIRGKELARLTPSTQIEGDSSYWRTNCSSSVCVWTGSNVYIFDTSKIPAAVKAKILKGTSLAAIVSAGSGIETFVVDSNQLNKF
ncbi:hypothetical protein [Deinococcus hopiensis]|uniref:Uncharacterized protein n=1 Tax=Deinococcus hopiensis KR-140 TaxID=695939 RepID=A0A1W1V6T4_9DEIO|nr:hypothetical protein [Deinococcus hopiensis]SMB89108.1 hypothetical protein SAMN00790413_00273 [Deinococcus hopiensis KR-140]